MKLTAIIMGLLLIFGADTVAFAQTSSKDKKQTRISRSKKDSKKSKSKKSLSSARVASKEQVKNSKEEVKAESETKKEKPLKGKKSLTSKREATSMTKTEKKIFVTDYLIYSSILHNQFASPNKWYDNLSVPSKENKFYNEYKKFFITKLKANKIERVYLIGKEQNIFFDEFIKDKNCIISNQLNEILIEIKIDKCKF